LLFSSCLDYWILNIGFSREYELSSAYYVPVSYLDTGSTDPKYIHEVLVEPEGVLRFEYSSSALEFHESNTEEVWSVFDVDFI